MCGIVGYAGASAAQEFLLAGLKRLEYRGYDSAGVAIVGADRLVRARTAGRVEQLVTRLSSAPLEGKIGIGHTRWATHGAPTEENAHPHIDCTGEFAVVHNGIVENYLALAARLREGGHHLASQTDTEVVVHLLEEMYAGDLLTALQQVARVLSGSYALVALTSREPGRLVGICKENPLVAGIGDGENYLASDLPALLLRTRRGIALEDGDCVAVTASDVEVFGPSGPKMTRPFTVAWTPEQAERGGYPYFMAKEIAEQPAAFRDTLRGRIHPSGKDVLIPEWAAESFTSFERIRLVACGTSYHAARIGETLFERLAGVQARAEVASEFRLRGPILSPKEPVLFVSQSGETLDTLMALREARRQGSGTWAITNVLGSSLDREAARVFVTQAGPEIAVASTKAFTTQLLALILLAVKTGIARGHLNEERASELLTGMQHLPAAAERVLEVARPWAAALGKDWTDVQSAFFLGRDVDFPVALEGALKLKEISYLHAEGLAAGEMKHGPLALVGPGVPVVAVITQKRVAEKMLANVVEAVSRGATPVAVGREDLLPQEITHACPLPEFPEPLMPALAVLPLQVLAYEAAVARGTDVDRPRNLAKSVTVE